MRRTLGLLVALLAAALRPCSLPALRPPQSAAAARLLRARCETAARCVAAARPAACCVVDADTRRGRSARAPRSTPAAAGLEHEAVHDRDGARPLRARRDDRDQGPRRRRRSTQDGVLHGNLYLQGGGDPALGTPAFYDRFLGGLGTNLFALKRAGPRGRDRARSPAGSTPTTRSSTACAASPTPATRPAPTSARSPASPSTPATAAPARSSFASDPAKVAAAKLVALAARGRVGSRRPGGAAGRRRRAPRRSPSSAPRRSTRSSTPPTSTPTTSSPRCC